MKIFASIRTVVIAVTLGLFFSLAGIAYATDTFYSVWPFWSIDVTTSGIGYFTGSLLQFGNTTNGSAHVSSAQSTAPALTSCGTSPAITGTDMAGIVTMGTGTPTGCVITFNVAYTGTPYCVVSWIATPLASQSYVTSNTAITLTQTATSSNKVQYICVGTAGG
jgi:hypothetical protein